MQYTRSVNTAGAALTDRVRLSVDGKHLKVDCGFGLDDSKSSDAQMHFCSDAQMPRSVKTAVLTC